MPRKTMPYPRYKIFEIVNGTLVRFSKAPMETTYVFLSSLFIDLNLACIKGRRGRKLTGDFIIFEIPDSISEWIIIRQLAVNKEKIIAEELLTK